MNEETKKYIDQKFAELRKSLRTLDAKKLSNTPIEAFDLTNKHYVDTTTVTLALGGTMKDGANIALGTATGTKIATATTQKLGFYGKTPISQYGSHGNISAGATYTSTEQNMINDSYNCLRALGLMSF